MLIKPEAIIFDIDNTLYPYAPAHEAAMNAVYLKANKVLGISKIVFQKAFKKSRDKIKYQLGQTASSHNRLIYFQQTIEYLGMKTQILFALDLEQTYWRVFLTNCILFPGVKNFMHLIKSAGIITLNITDLTAQIQFKKLIYLKLDNYFDYVVTSEEAGADKPDKRPFQIAIKKSGINPANVWMIGDDSIADIGGANNFGMTTIQKVHSGVKVDSHGPCKPFYTFNNYDHLNTKLSSLISI
jgi:HAD superfamily hydrolase (TIGR01509 family)